MGGSRPFRPRCSCRDSHPRRESYSPTSSRAAEGVGPRATPRRPGPLGPGPGARPPPRRPSQGPRGPHGLRPPPRPEGSAPQLQDEPPDSASSRIPRRRPTPGPGLRGPPLLPNPRSGTSGPLLRPRNFGDLGLDPHPPLRPIHQASVCNFGDPLPHFAPPPHPESGTSGPTHPAAAFAHAGSGT
ncbi:PREDICTED: basic proline-rich protein-like, partial [Chinchilla lanigera]|uniref:basic proline-rich protein-like n=1 Tax=Chinchilla lanigera TaxID=34839 RepID=UPI000697B9AE